MEYLLAAIQLAPSYDQDFLGFYIVRFFRVSEHICLFHLRKVSHPFSFAVIILQNTSSGL